MASLATVLLPLLELEDDDLFATALGDNLSRDLGALDEGVTKLGAFTAKEEDFFERNLVASGPFELFYSNEVALSDSVLLAAGADNCVCHGEGPRKLVCGQSPRKELGRVLVGFFSRRPWQPILAE